MGDPLRDALFDQLAGQIDKSIDRRLGGIERNVDGIGRDVDALAKQVGFLLRHAGIRPNDPDADTDGDPIAQLDQTWQCVKCGARLGFYSPSDDVLRVRHKDVTLWFQPGAGGKVSIICRGCGELNTVGADDDPGGASER